MKTMIQRIESVINPDEEKSFVLTNTPVIGTELRCDFSINGVEIEDVGFVRGCRSSIYVPNTDVGIDYDGLRTFTVTNDEDVPATFLEARFFVHDYIYGWGQDKKVHKTVISHSDVQVNHVSLPETSNISNGILCKHVYGDLHGRFVNFSGHVTLKSSDKNYAEMITDYNLIEYFPELSAFRQYCYDLADNLYAIGSCYYVYNHSVVDQMQSGILVTAGWESSMDYGLGMISNSEQTLLTAGRWSFNGSFYIKES